MPARRVEKAGGNQVRPGAKLFFVSVVYEDRGAPGGLSAVHVAPAIADHETLPEIDTERFRSIQQHARFRFAPPRAGTIVRVAAYFETIDRQRRAHGLVDIFQYFGRLRASADIRLIGHYHKKEARALEKAACLPDAIQNFKLLHRIRRIGFAVAHHGPIDDAIAIEKDGPAHSLALVRYHFVALSLSFGCETSRCQNTAWNASECGVT